MEKPRTILMLAFPGVQMLDVTGPLQMFAAANNELSCHAYRILIAAPAAGPFATSSGVRLVADLSFADLNGRRLRGVHTLMVAGGHPGVEAALKAGDAARIVARAKGIVPRLSSVCSGAFILAAAGVLDGRRAATHWDGIEQLRRFRPAVVVDDDAIHVEDRGIWTSAGVTAGMDLALAMIEADHGRAVALAIARRHVIFRVRPGGQSQFSSELAAQTVDDPRLSRLAEQVTNRPNADWNVERLAATAGLSVRSMSRLSRARFGASPAEFVERIRLDVARRQLLDTARGIKSIAVTSGFGSARRMDRAFARKLAVSPTEFRSRFKTQGDAPCSSTRSASSSSRI
jgi:transcriptional regulator GlxA family with amidase domain